MKMKNKTIGAAIDIGTTTVVLHLVDIETGAKLATVSRINAQSPYGADVTARIRYCKQNGHETLTKLIREQIASMITTNIEHITIAANTIMQHLVAGYSPVDMGVAPFTPISLFGDVLPAWEGLSVSKNAKIYYTPAISAYVGGDITAGLLAAEFDNISDPAIFLDIGTNGEIVLKHKGIYYCCATAAGPAFEGAEIEMGMAAENGAIDHVWLSSGTTRQGDGSSVLPASQTEQHPCNNGKTDEPSPCLVYTTIGNATPKGICGSGLLDTLAVLLDMGEVDETGRLLNKDKFWVDEKHGIYITAEDIRKLQLAKAAIAAGIQVLLHFAGIHENDIKLLALAGGFGSYMDLQSAARIGLFPKILLPVAKSYGNTAGEGAVLALTSEEARTKLESIRNQCEYIELSSIAFFNDRFVDEMSFEGLENDK